MLEFSIRFQPPLMARQVICLLFLFFTAILSAFSQEGASKKDKKRARKFSIEENVVSTYKDSDLFHFPNLTKQYYFKDEKLAKEIIELNKNKDWETLYPILRYYVKNFGIVNFYKDTYWIWRLAKLTEMYGNYQEAILLYKLVLRHHREDIDIRSVELHFDSLTTNDKDYFVPLDYYYELVDYRSEIDTLKPPRSVLLNMGELVNSEKSDYGPTLNAEDNTLVFTSKRNSHHRGFGVVHDEDIFYSKKVDGQWGPSQEFKGINTPYNEGSMVLSKDGKMMIFARCNSPDSYGDCDLFTARLVTDSLWGDVKNLGVQVNSTAWDSHPSLSHSEDTLYFSSDRIGGFGLADIYYCVKNEDGSWGKAVNVGPIINSRNSEVSPFFHHEYNVLYFSSNGQNLNFGEFDIYKSYYQENNWGEPKNIGPLVNGPGSEFYFTIDSKSDLLFYAKSVENDMSNMDLYSFPLPMGAQPSATTVVKGQLVNEETGTPYTGIVSIIDLDNGIEVAPKFMRPDGTFEFDLINHNNYLLIIQGDEFFRIEELFYLDGQTEIERTAAPIRSKMEFTTIEFENNTAELKKEMYDDLDKIADFLLDNPGFFLKISGHTDSQGRETFNLKLSQDRAAAIKEYLVFFGGVKEERITANGYGSSRPIVEEKTDEDRKLNRRVEFELFKNKPPDDDAMVKQ